MAPPAVALALVPVRSHVRDTNVALVLVVVIVAAAVLDDRRGGVLAALSSAVAFDLFFTRPYGSLVIDRSADIETAVLLLGVGLAVGELVVRARAATRDAARERAETQQVRRLSALVAGSAPRGALIVMAQTEIEAVLDTHGSQFEPVPFRTPLPTLGHGSIRFPAMEDKPRPAASARVEAVELPVCGGGRPVGRFVLQLPGAGVGVDPSARALAVALADQLGAALARGGAHG